ncbi:TRAP transporter small permease [Marinobacterium lutimaris]|uniref:TRAP transporter small permease protein n=1 Tax=Marinobacterium lutimaris TaxID=568106 RepID=A0A1H6CPS6_9GAMM|nr:TRAP transporter small permease [Marinobacterium lutimaris]SEG75004.1 TRAP-type C4-dicarboxylate transport system, small permease component [Marinobacterium lutimaris]
MSLLVKLAERSSVCLALLGSLGILAMMLHIVLDVVLRATLSVSIPSTLEIVTRYYMVTLALLPLAWVEWRKQMIFVESLSGMFGACVTRWLDALVALLSAGIYLVLVVATWNKAVEQYDIGAYVMSLDFPMPVWPTYFILPLAFALAALVSLVRIPLIITNNENYDRV